MQFVGQLETRKSKSGTDYTVLVLYLDEVKIKEVFLSDAELSLISLIGTK